MSAGKKFVLGMSLIAVLGSAALATAMKYCPPADLDEKFRKNQGLGEISK